MLQPGATLNYGQYVISRLIGQGGFSFVYLARDVPMAEEVAVKELIPTLVTDPDALKRFVNEARGSRQLAHANVVRTYNFFQESGNYYTVMEYVAGGSLADQIFAYGAAPIEQAVRLGAEIAGGLQCAHDHQIVHCDLKPANILMTPDGHAKVGDFGIAHIGRLAASQSWRTAQGFVAGTVPYMAPEQIDGERCDPRIDVYALGAVLYLLVTGKTYLPFDERDTPRAQADNINRIAAEAVLPPSVYNGYIPPWLDAVILAALAKRPSDRFATAADLAAALRAGPAGVAAGVATAVVASVGLNTPPPAVAPVVVPPPSRGGQTPPPVVRPPTAHQPKKPFPLWGALVLVAVLTLGIFGAFQVGRGLGGNTAALSTLAPTATPLVVALIPTATTQPTETTAPPTATRTARPRDTSTPPPTATATRTTAPSATASNTPRATQPPAKAAATPGRSSSLLPAPSLAAPAHNARFSSAENPMLKWSAVKASLGRDEVYVVTIPYKRMGQTWTDYVVTQGTSWSLNEHKYLLDLVDEPGQFQWSVQLIRKTGEKDGVPEGVALSAPSERRVFYYTRAAGDRPAPTDPVSPIQPPSPGA